MIFSSTFIFGGCNICVDTFLKNVADKQTHSFFAVVERIMDDGKLDQPDQFKVPIRGDIIL